MSKKKINVVKEFTFREETCELRGQEKKKKKEKKKALLQIQDKQTPHTTLQKLSPKRVTGSLNKRFSLREWISEISTFLKNSHPRKGPMSFAAKEK